MTAKQPAQNLTTVVTPITPQEKFQHKNQNISGGPKASKHTRVALGESRDALSGSKESTDLPSGKLLCSLIYMIRVRVNWRAAGPEEAWERQSLLK